MEVSSRHDEYVIVIPYIPEPYGYVIREPNGKFRIGNPLQSNLFIE